MIILLKEFCESFAENKDVAKELRVNVIKKHIEAIARDPKIVLDFEGIDSSTQSFVHALISGVFQDYGEAALDIFEFKNCNETIKSLITTVVNYSLG